MESMLASLTVSIKFTPPGGLVAVLSIVNCLWLLSEYEISIELFAKLFSTRIFVGSNIPHATQLLKIEACFH